MSNWNARRGFLARSRITLAEKLAAARTGRRIDQAESPYEELVHASPDAIIGRTLDGVVTSWNPAAERILGYSAAEMVGQHLARLVPEEALGEFEGLSDALRVGVSITIKTTRIAKNGDIVPVALSIAPMHDKAGRITSGVVIMRDISETRVMEQKLEEAQRLSSLGRLAATMAHEFNNVLMGIAPFADLLLRSSEARTQTAARHIKTSIGRGKRVTEEILQYTRQAPPTLSRVDVTDWLDSLRPELRIMLPASVTLSVAVRPGVGSMVAEATQMSQVISNLVLNARDALPDGGLNCDYS